MAAKSAMVTVARSIALAPGVFAPGHLGELTQVIPFDLVDAVLAETGRIQQRVRRIPARVALYLVLAMALFGHVGLVGVWAKLTCSLGSGMAAPCEKALLSCVRLCGTGVSWPVTQGVEMSRPPVFPPEQKTRIVLSILAGEITIAEAARQYKVSEQSVGTWKRQFLEAGRAGLTSATSKTTSREAQLERENEELKAALGEAAVELRVWKKSAEYLAPSRTSR